MTPTRADLERLIETWRERARALRCLREIDILRFNMAAEWGESFANQCADELSAILTSKEPAQRPETPEASECECVCHIDALCVACLHCKGERVLKAAAELRPETPTVGTCATCRHFRPYTADYGACLSTEAYDKGCSAEVEASFGCILHAPLPDAPKEPTPA